MIKRRIALQKKKLLILYLTTALTLTAVTLAVYRDDLSYFTHTSRAAIARQGSSGQEVIDIQDKLYKWGYYNGIVDGVYGYRTYQAVRSFQSKNGLSVDGVAGNETLAALGLNQYVTGGTSTGTASSKNVDLLAHIIHGEARGEPYIGQVAIAAVVLNRTRDGRFPKTIAGVIYQPGAFDAVADGQFNLPPTQTAYKAARDALNGWDPSYGCIYYYNPATATSKWIWTRPIVLKIGKHNFAK